MKEFILSAKELLFLCGQMGAKQVFGVENAFLGMEITEISNEISRIQSSLERKCYMESDFDGNSSLRKDLTELLLICITCRKAVKVDCQKEKQSKILVYYMSGNQVVRSEKIDGLYHLNLTDKVSMQKDITINLVSECKQSAFPMKRTGISQKSLKEAKALVLTGNQKQAEVLLCNHIDSNISNVLIQMWLQKQSISSVTMIDFDAEEKVQNLTVLITEQGNIGLERDVKDLITQTEFFGIDKETIKRHLSRLE